MNGIFGSQPAAKPLVVFHLGVQWNHPLGILAPGISTLSQKFTAMTTTLTSRRAEFGFLGMTSHRSADRGSNNTLLLTMYFRDLESLHAFAHEPLHREAWDWYSVKKHAHIGIFHETFCVPAKAWETVYVNCHPVGLGRTAEAVEGGQKWVNPLVSADMPALKTQYARLGRHENGVPMDIKSDRV
jgi:fumagillin biosynthesis monooxygenase